MRGFLAVAPDVVRAHPESGLGPAISRPGSQLRHGISLDPQAAQGGSCSMPLRPFRHLRTPDRPRRAARRGRRPPARQPGAGNRAAPHPAGLLLALPEADPGAVRRAVRRRPAGGADGCRHPDHDRQADRPADHPCAGPAVGRGLAGAGRHGRAGADRPALRPAAAEPDHPAGHQRQRHQPDPLAEPLAGGPPGPALLPGGFRRPHRQPGDAGRAGAAGERRPGHQRGLVHPGLRHRGGAAAGADRLAAGFADRSPGSRSMPCCCASWCRGCATARARPRRSAAC